ncbi:MAG: BamA/TamA family outer membrane protein, partial [Holosporaceae bacterium]|jgi:translocation and assembly module TamA|nr:BamA/TamA family outer membrane protein [Holosporaceae bacterium]
VVLFFDGAKIFQNKSRYDELKIDKKRWFFSIGSGIRYFTSIGPIRIDFAFPIRRRKGIDSKMQFIISLGQAF